MRRRFFWGMVAVAVTTLLIGGLTAAVLGCRSGRGTAVAQPFRLGDRGTLVVAIGTSLELIPWREVLLRFVWALGLALVLAAVLAGSLSRFAGRGGGAPPAAAPPP